MKSGGTMSNKSSTLVSVLVILMLLVQHGSAGLYACWGGCLNECFFLNKRSMGRFPCYVNCLARCFTLPPGSDTPTVPDNQDGGPAPSPSDLIADLDIKLDSEAYADLIIGPTPDMAPTTDIGVPNVFETSYCIFNCSEQTCKLHNHGESDLKSCLATCVKKCNNLNG